MEASLKREHSRTEEGEKGPMRLFGEEESKLKEEQVQKGPEVEECLVCLK